MEEQHVVKLNYKKPDGYWVIGHKIEVSVSTDFINEKNNHFAAERKAKKLFPGCKIVSVVYC